MTPWIVWRIRRNPNRRWALECKCGIAYWTDVSGWQAHRHTVGHAPSEREG